MSEEGSLVYHPLTDDGDIRLIRLKPNNNSNELIQCSIVHENLKRRPAYTALSYMWGSPTEELLIEVNNVPCKVRPNLKLALQYLRHTTDERDLWIDALCINQRDVIERNHQVNQMSRIYSLATNVIAWLGEGAENSSVGINYLLQKSTQQTHLATDTLIDDDIWFSILSLCKREYWTRLWIVQEVILPRKVMLLCGKDMIDLQDLAFYLLRLGHGHIFCNSQFLTTPTDEILWANNQPHNTLIPLLSQKDQRRFVQAVVEYRESSAFSIMNERIKRSFDDRPLLSLSLHYGKSTCEDLRDRVFGLHGIASECCKNAIPVDYSLSVPELSDLLVEHQKTAHELPNDELRIRSFLEDPYSESSRAFIKNPWGTPKQKRVTKDSGSSTCWYEVDYDAIIHSHLHLVPEKKETKE